MKSIQELFDDWENGSLSHDELQQLKQLLADPAARAELHKELAFYGMLNDVLGLFEISPEVASPRAKEILQLSPLAALSLLWEKCVPASLRSARAIVAGCVLLAGLAGLVIWYEHPRPIGTITQAGNALRIRRAGKEYGARPETKVFSGDTIIAPQFQSAAMAWDKEETKLFLAPQTEIQVRKKWQGKEIALVGGVLKAVVAKQSAKRPLVVKSPQAVMKVIGTRFTLSALKNRSRLEVVDGTVEFKESGTNRPAALVLSAGQYAMAGPDVTAQVQKIDGMLWWEVWRAGGMSLANDVPAPATILNQDYLPTPQTLVWLYPFLTDDSKRYRERVRGILTPKESGDYLFWMMSEGASELWFSSDESPSNKVLIASTPAPQPGARLGPTWNWVLRPGQDQSSMRGTPWNKFPSQKSQPHPLVAGRRYYFEALHEAAIDDSIAVIWAKPGEDTLIPSGAIPSQYLSPVRE